MTRLVVALAYQMGVLPSQLLAEPGDLLEALIDYRIEANEQQAEQQRRAQMREKLSKHV